MKGPGKTAQKGRKRLAKNRYHLFDFSYLKVPFDLGFGWAVARAFSALPTLGPGDAD
jgi:hypothetical protein